tara:strand:+ start:1528 stop:2511 length:984 start_codon:yes stop_codon:yes gene_type:complete
MLESKNKKLFFIGLSWFGLILINPILEAKNFMELHKGTVKLIRNDESRILKKTGEEFLLLAGDRLQTGQNTNLSLYLKDKENTIKLFSNSFFKLEELAKEGNSVSLMTGKGNFKVKPIEDTKSEQVENDSISKTNKENKSVEKSKSKFSGQFEKLTKSKIIRRKKRFSIRTVSAVVGVRGTEFVVAPTDDSTKVLGLSGEVTLASPEVPNYEIPVLANQASHVNEGSGPSVPVTVTPAESEKIVSGEGSEGFNEVKFGPSELISTIQQRLQNDDETPQFQDEQDETGRFLEQLDRLEELESIVENAENTIYSTKQKILTLSVSFTNR